jgi:hypothetical protein
MWEKEDWRFLISWNSVWSMNFLKKKSPFNHFITRKESPRTWICVIYFSMTRIKTNLSIVNSLWLLVDYHASFERGKKNPCSFGGVSLRCSSEEGPRDLGVDICDKALNLLMGSGKLREGT